MMTKRSCLLMWLLPTLVACAAPAAQRPLAAHEPSPCGEHMASEPRPRLTVTCPAEGLRFRDPVPCSIGLVNDSDGDLVVNARFILGDRSGGPFADYYLDAYLLPMRKRVSGGILYEPVAKQPQASDFVCLRPGESRTTTTDVAFYLRAPGTYEIEAHYDTHDDPDGAWRGRLSASSSVSVTPP